MNLESSSQHPRSELLESNKPETAKSGWQEGISVNCYTTFPLLTEAWFRFSWLWSHLQNSSPSPRELATHVLEKCRSAGQEGTFLLLPEVTNLRPSPSWKSPFNSCSSVVFSCSSFALWSSHTLLCKVSVKTLWVFCLYTLMVCSLLTSSWSPLPWRLSASVRVQLPPERPSTSQPQRKGSRHSPQLQAGQPSPPSEAPSGSSHPMCQAVAPAVLGTVLCCLWPPLLHSPKQSLAVFSRVSGFPCAQTHDVIAKNRLCCSWASLIETTVNWALKYFSISGPRLLQHSMGSNFLSTNNISRRPVQWCQCLSCWISVGPEYQNPHALLKMPTKVICLFPHLLFWLFSTQTYYVFHLA